MHRHDIDSRTPWFRAKRYGYGWSRPLTWQGWLVIGVYCALVAGGALLLARGEIDRTLYAAFALLLTLALIAICWRTGEPPRWRWGDRD